MPQACKLIVVFFLFQLNEAFSQFYSTGSEPFSIKWEQLNTDTFQIIYPKGFYTEANKLLNYFEKSAPFVNKTLGANPRKISIILHNQTVLSNGFVTMAPRRMEIVTTPPYNIEATHWYQNLALHEYRHVSQINRMNLGFTKIFKYLIGESSFGLPALEIPLWIIEGDAVATETALSSSGRGRLPNFEMFLKALHTNKTARISYDKSYFGSYKDYIPDRYELGYQLISYSRIKYGHDIWKNSIENTGKYAFIPFSLNCKLKRAYHTSIDKIYNNTIDTLINFWNSEIEKIISTDNSELLIRRPHTYTNYKYPMMTSENQIFTVKSGFDDIEQIVTIDSMGIERKIQITGNTYNSSYSIGKNLIAWTEIIPDIRWEQRDYSIIKVLDIVSGKVKSVSKKSRFFSPDVSKDDSKIVAIEVDLKNNCFAVILDSETGDEQLRIESLYNEYLQYPKWLNDTAIVLIGNSDYGKNLYLVDIKRNNWIKLYGPVFNNLAQPVIWKKYILFRADYNDEENIYAFDTESSEIFQVTFAKFGASDPYITINDNLIYSNYTSRGYSPVKISLNPDKWMDLEIKRNDPWLNKITEQEKVNVQKMVTPDKKYISKPYHQINHLINFHTWIPFYIEPSFDNITDNTLKPGFIILSQNKLNTLTSSVGLSYFENYFYLHPRFTYRGFYPVFDFSSNIGGSMTYYPFPEGISPVDSISTKYSITLKTYIPFNFSNNEYFKFFQPEIETKYNNALYYNNKEKTGIVTLQYKLSLICYLKTTSRDIFPKWAQTFYFSFTHTPRGSNLFGNLFFISSSFYFPGIYKHHSIKNSFFSQFENLKSSSKYYYPYNYITLPRGYSSIIKTFKSKKILKYSFDYNLPLFYPDLSIPSFIYIKRFRLNVFFDIAYGENVIEYYEKSKIQKTGYYHSTGIDLLTDFHLFRFLFPFSMGPRITYISNNQYYIGFNFNINTSIF